MNRAIPLAATLAVVAWTSAIAAPPAGEAAFVSLRDSGRMAELITGTRWPGGPKMLYTSATSDGAVVAATSPAEGALYLFDGGDGRLLGRVATGAGAKGVKIAPDDRHAYVSNQTAGTVSVVDLASRKVVATIETGQAPHNVRFSPDGALAYVTLQGGGALGVIDTASHRLVRRIPVPGLAAPHNLDIDAEGRRAFVRGLDDHVAVIDLASGERLALLRVGRGHAGIDLAPGGRFAYTGAIADQVVTVIDAGRLEVVARIEVGPGPHGVRTSRDGRLLYVAVTGADQVAVIDTRTRKVVKRYDLDSFPFWIAVPGNP